MLVEIKATGICHTDEYTLSGAIRKGFSRPSSAMKAPASCVEVGPGVKSLKKGDHVIPLYTPECRECEYCLNPKTNLCQSIRATQGQGVMPDGIEPVLAQRQDDLPLHGHARRFPTHRVLPEIALAKIRDDAPFDKVCYIGCGVTTGVGAVINTAKVEPGSQRDRLRSRRHRPQRDPGRCAWSAPT